MPEECASIRSIARCVLPVLVGPSTAVTPEPRARSSRSARGENEIDIESPAKAVSRRKGLSITTGALESPVLNVWNESGTNRGRIGDSAPFVFVHCDIWRRQRCCIPDRVEFDTVAACLGWAKGCSARKQDSDESQGAKHCGQWGWNAAPASGPKRHCVLAIGCGCSVG